MAATLLYERAYKCLHQREEAQNLDRETQELEAETVAFMVCSHFWIDVPSHKYLATWQKSHQMMDSPQRISKCSQKMIPTLENRHRNAARIRNDEIGFTETFQE
ncbi:MAG: hypothetical protein O7E52_18400 [Candidatus Poribacteria bacterium]|nr:hypothetical protein [Candidatus Poribacteria bacterium]